MRSIKKIDRISIIFAVIAIGVLFATMLSRTPTATFADDGTETVASSSDHHLIIYDQGKKISVKTDAATVAEALSRASLSLGDYDTTNPSLETTIDADNFYINIYRAHPVIIKIGAVEKYLMTTSYDPKTIAKTAGLTIYDGDEINLVANNNFLEAGIASVYEVSRNGGETITTEEEISFGNQTVKDYNLEEGTEEVRQLGEVGRKQVVYNVKFVDGAEVSREIVSETIIKEPVDRIVAVGASEIERNPLTASKGRNYYTIRLDNGSVIERQETYYDLPMSLVMQYRIGDGCGDGTYSVRSDGVKIDSEGYVLVAANLNRYPLCSVVETSLGTGKVYDTGTFAASNPEQFDIATDWSDWNGI